MFTNLNFTSLQGFLESSFGQSVTTLIVFLIFVLVSRTGRDEEAKKKGINTKAMALSAIFVALYLILDQIILFRMPQGGSITAFSMLTIVLAGYFLGVRRGVMTGLAAGLIDLLFNPYVIHPLQLLLDYPFAVGALALGAFLRNKKYGLQMAFVFGATSRFICTFLSGVIFFGQYAPENFNAFTWSFYYNIMYIGAESILTLIILFLPPFNKALARLKNQLSI